MFALIAPAVQIAVVADSSAALICAPDVMLPVTATDPVAVTDLQAFLYAIAGGFTASEWEPESKAAEKIAQLWAWLNEQKLV